MSPRLKITRKITNPPAIKGFKPYGPDLHNIDKEIIIMLYEEYEAIKMCDYDLLNHVDAAKIMNVSRPTFTRIYATARQKMAKAIVEGRQISIEGGKVSFDSDWYYCNNCNCNFNNPHKEIKIINCAFCGSDNIENYLETNEIKNEELKKDLCICPKCGYEQMHKLGNPCKKVVCPECNSPMQRKNVNNCLKNN